MAGSGANGVRRRVVRDERQKCFRRQSGECARQPGLGAKPYFPIAVIIVGLVSIAIKSIEAGESLPEIRSPEWNAEQPRIRQPAPAADDRRPRATETNWGGAVPPVWLWRHLDAVPRRLDSAEGRLARIEALIEMRLDQMVEGERSRNAKEDLWRDQESRRIELSFDRLERRLAYMETRLADAATADRVAAAAASPRLQEQIRCQQEKLEERVDGVRRVLVEVVPSAVAAAIADKMKALLMPTPLPTPNFQINSHPPHQPPPTACPSAEEYASNISKHAHETLMYLKQKLTEEFGLQAEKFVSKVGNMYNDLWDRAQSIESLIKDSLVLGNSTQRDLHEGFHAVVQQQQEQLLLMQQQNLPVQREKHGSHSASNRRLGGASTHGLHNSANRDSGKGEWSIGDALELGLGSLELSVDTLSGTVARRLGELGRRLDSSFRMLLLAQNLFLESCHRIQLGEPTLEARLSVVLEKLLDTVSNRSQGFYREAVEIKGALYSQTNQIISMIENTESNIVSAIREGSEWQMAEFVVENQRTKDEILTWAKGVTTETKPELCTLLHENANETTLNEDKDGEQIKADSWNKISTDISDPNFQFHHISAVLKNTDSTDDMPVVAIFQKKPTETVNLDSEIENETVSLEFNAKTFPGLDPVNYNESLASKNISNYAANTFKSSLNQTVLNPEEIVGSISDSSGALFEHEILSTVNAHNYRDTGEHKRSTDNVTSDGLSSQEMKELNESHHLEAIIGALADHIILWDTKNNSGILEVGAKNSSTEEMKKFVKGIILQIANEENDLKELMLNRTLDSVLDDASISHFMEAILRIYKTEDMDLNLELMKAKVEKNGKIDEELKSVPEVNAETENTLQLNGQAFNVTKESITLYLKRIIHLASQLDSNSSNTT